MRKISWAFDTSLTRRHSSGGTVRRVALFFALVALPVSVSSQAPSPSFEIVSVKPTPPGTQGGGVQFSPGGRVTWRNTTLNGMVAAAYQRFTWDSREIIGGPDWFNDARFDVVAVSPGGLPPVDADGFPSRLLAMLRGVLEDRFKVVARWTRAGVQSQSHL
jgi:hypothetical protein